MLGKVGNHRRLPTPRKEKPKRDKARKERGIECILPEDEEDFNAKLKSIQDGTGLIYDPEGVHHQDLLRLFEEGLGVAKFKSDLLHEEGFLLLMHQRRSISTGLEEIKILKKQNKRNSGMK